MNLCPICNARIVEVPEDIKRIVEGIGSPICESCFDDWRAKAEVNKKPEPELVPYKGKYEFKPGMAEISGFGGDYEQACRNMLAAGLEWLDAHPNADLRFRHVPQVFGIVLPTTSDTKALSEAVSKAIPGCSGAMHHAVINHLMFIKGNGWDKYCEEMSKPEQAEAGSAG